jgi:betaine-aldehyde dehydrogenase
MNAPAQIRPDNHRREAAPGSVRRRRLDTPTQVGRKARAGAVRGNRFIGGFRRPVLGQELGRNAAADYSEEKTFHVHDGPCAHWRLAPDSST